MANDSLLNAKKTKNDEFYTVFEYVQKEMNAYLEYDSNVFNGKTVLLPCDDPEWSNFTRFFAQNFDTLGLKKLISTSYSLDSKKSQYEQYHQLTLFEMNSPQYNEEKSHTKGKIFTLTKDINKSGNIDINDLEWKYLEGDGDFRSDEVKTLRNEADIIVTNPPFSLFKDGSPINPSSFSHLFDKRLKCKGFKHIRFHDLRHPYVKLTTKRNMERKKLKLPNFSSLSFCTY